MGGIPHSFQQKIFRIDGFGGHFKDLVKDLISQNPSPVSGTLLPWPLLLGQQILQVVVHARNAKIQIFSERIRNVDRVMRPILAHDHKPQNIIFRFVQTGQNFILGDRDGGGSLNSPFDLDKEKMAGSRIPGFDIIPPARPA